MPGVYKMNDENFQMTHRSIPHTDRQTYVSIIADYTKLFLRRKKTEKKKESQRNYINLSHGATMLVRERKKKSKTDRRHKYR